MMNQKLMRSLGRSGGGLYGKTASMVNQVYKPIDTTYTPAPVQPSAGLYGPAAAMVDEVYKPIDNTYTPTPPQTKRALAPRNTNRMLAPSNRSRMSF